MTNPLKNMNILDYYIVIFSIHYYLANPPNLTLLFYHKFLVGVHKIITKYVFYCPSLKGHYHNPNLRS
jgi:hypothetical protein